jgi:hypothetical protein
MRQKILTIKQIIDADTVTYGPLTSQEVADILNIKNITQQRETISGSELLAATDVSE